MKVYRYYEANGKSGEGWYVAFMDEMGFVCIQSDWGDYSYGWHCRGEGKGIREFLLECDDGYLTRKFSPKRVIDERATRAGIKKALAEGPLDGFKLEDEEELLEGADLSTEFGISQWMSQTSVEDAHEMVVMGDDPQIVAFLKNVWPRLCAKMRAELEEEEAAKKASNDRILAQLEESRRLGAR